MTSEQWRQVEDLFHQALDRPPDARESFLNQVCADDRELRQQVEGLLASFEDAGDFIETPFVDGSLSSETPKSVAPELIIGHKIGGYEILSLLGAGGMGEVYLARDTRLDRQIALKLLPAQFTQYPEQVERFEREARAASALNHPNIITIYEIGQEGDIHFIATEFVEGSTLRELIAKGKIKLRDALNMSIQIASALATAHTAGIVHRDIKPENVMVRPDGLVKLLDFGLAKPIKSESTTGNLQLPGAAGSQPGAAGLQEDNRQTDFGQTDPVMMMGTLAYLSPEQARMEKADRRTDVFSLGVVIYEMATGEQPFRGENPSAILTAIMNQPQAPITSLNAELPAELERILQRALAKDRDRRYQTAGEFRDDLLSFEQKLQASKDETSSQNQPPPQWLKRRVKTSSLAFGAVAVVIAVWLWSSGRNGDKATPWSDARSIRLTYQSGPELFPSLAADGKSFVYANQASGNWDICHQNVNGEMFRNLTQDCAEDDTQPALSPDNALIAFRSERDGGGLFVMNSQGGSVRKISNEGFHPAWSPDSREIIYTLELVDYPQQRRIPPDGLWAINLKSGEKRQISDQDIAMPQWSPNGLRIAYWGQRENTQRDIWTIPASGGDPVAVTNDEYLDWNPVWSPDGKYLYFASNRAGTMNLWRVAIDEKSGLTHGQVEQVREPSTYSQHLTFSRDGRSLAYVGVNTQKNLRRVAFDPERGVAVGAPQWVTTGSRWVIDSDISPDGEWLVCSSGGDEQEDLFLIKSDGSDKRHPLTNDTSKDRGPRWSPDGKRIAFYSDRGGSWEIWIINADGSGLRRLTFTSGARAFFPLWSPDGTRIIYTTGAAAPFMIEVDKPWQEQTPKPLLSASDSDLRFWARSWSVTGNNLAGGYRKITENKLIPAIYSFISGQFEPLINQEAEYCLWLNDDRRLLYLHDGKIFLVDCKTKQTREALSADSNKINRFVLSRDNRSLFYDVEVTEADIWLLSLK